MRELVTIGTAGCLVNTGKHIVMQMTYLTMLAGWVYCSSMLRSKVNDTVVTPSRPCANGGCERPGVVIANVIFVGARAFCWLCCEAIDSLGVIERRATPRDEQRAIPPARLRSEGAVHLS